MIYEHYITALNTLLKLMAESFDYPLTTNLAIGLITTLLYLAYFNQSFLNKDLTFLSKAIRTASKGTFWMLFCGIFVSLWMVYGYLSFALPKPHIYHSINSLMKAFWVANLIAIALGLLIAPFLQLLIKRNLEPSVAGFIERLGKRKVDIYKTPSAKTLGRPIPNAKPFDPSRYFKEAQKCQSYFIGLNDVNKPVYLPYEEFNSSHMLVLGFTGFGKGTFVNNILWQAIAQKTTTVLFQPKVDEWSASVLDAACKNANKKLTRINLNAPIASINPILGCNENELFEILTSTFDLVTSSKESDFHKLRDRKGAKLFSKIMRDLPDATLTDLVKHQNKYLNGLEKECVGLITQIEELADLPQTQVIDGFDLQTFINSGDCLLVESNVGNESLKLLSKMIFTRLMQIAENRTDKNKHLLVFCDEARHKCSIKYLQALGTIRDKNVNIISACQSIADLEVPQAGYDAQTVKNTILDNNALKWCYRSNYETAKWVSEQAGSMSVNKEIQTTYCNEAVSESAYGDKKIVCDEVPIIHPNEILGLPKFTAVALGMGTCASISSTGTIRVNKVDVPHLEGSPQPHKDEGDLL